MIEEWFAMNAKDLDELMAMQEAVINSTREALEAYEDRLARMKAEHAELLDGRD